MKKILLFIMLLLPIKVIALTYPELHYENIIIYDLTDKTTLYESNSNEKRSIASLTKLMTIITAIEKIDNPSKEIVYTQEMANNVAWYASVAGFKIGEIYTVEDLLYGAMLPSGADATVALAYTASGNVDSFVNDMNELANRIGMKNSNFVNVHGLDEDNHYSTAEDLKLLLEYALQNETFKKVYTTKEYTMSNDKKLQSTVLKQGNKYNLDTTKILGSKTGFTANAGLCISVLMKDENHEIIIITLGAPSNENIPYNVTDALELISFVEENNNYETIITKGIYTNTLKVELSTINKYDISSTKEISLYLPKDYNKEDIKINYNGISKLSYKNLKQEKLGTISYYYKDNLLDTETIYLNTNIKPSYKKIITKYKDKIILIALSIIVILITPFIILISKSKTHK